MQLEKFKRKLSVALASVLTCTLIISFFNIYGAAADGPISSVGTQTPVMFAQFTDSSGQTADGNALTPGTYEMVLRVDDLASISQMQFTASYDPALLAFSDGSLPLASATGLNINAVQSEFSNGSFVFAYNSGNYDSNSALAANGAELLRINVTVSDNNDTAVDMNTALQVDKNPNRTFIEVDYGDVTVSGTSYFYKCYALSTASDFNGEVHPMKCDLSPELATGHSVSAYIGALTAPSDEYGSYPVTGAQVSVEVGGETVTAETDESGKFIFNNVPAGSYTATVSYKYGFTRTFTIEVADSDVESSTMVGIVACDWSKDSVINSNDKLSYLSLVSVKAGSDKYDLGVDIDRNGVINTNDKIVYLSFVGTKSVDFVYHNTIISSAEVIQ